MSDVSKDRLALARHRLERADEFLDEASSMLQAGHPKGAVNRYY